MLSMLAHEIQYTSMFLRGYMSLTVLGEGAIPVTLSSYSVMIFGEHLVSLVGV